MKLLSDAGYLLPNNTTVVVLFIYFKSICEKTLTYELLSTVNSVISILLQISFTTSLFLFFCSLSMEKHVQQPVSRDGLCRLRPDLSWVPQIN